MNHWLILLTSLSPLLAEIPPCDISSDISSNTASYNEDILVLKGNVILDHDLGQMKAEVATLDKRDPSLEFSSILLQKEVSIFFESQGNLFSDRAFFDFQTLLGEASSQKRPVIYKGKDFDLFSRKINLSLSREGKLFEISNLIAQEEVHIDYQTDFHIDCETAIYEGHSLTATGEGLSTLTHLEDWVDAKKIHVDLTTDLLSLESPKGELSSFFFPDNLNRKCQFTSHLLTWDHQNDHLLLKGGVVIHDSFFGTLVGEDIFSLQQKKHFGKRTIQSIETEGKTILSSNNGSSLTSYGTLKLDQDKLLITCKSPPDKQLRYENKELLLFADTARVEYSIQGSKPQTQTIYLDGNVQFFSHDLSRPLKKGLADHVVHNPQSMTTHLLADSENTVLFWDQEKKQLLSAPEVLITHDEKEEVVKGIGIVRFTFTEEEGKRIGELLP